MSVQNAASLLLEKLRNARENPPLTPTEIYKPFSSSPEVQEIAARIYLRYFNESYYNNPTYSQNTTHYSALLNFFGCIPPRALSEEPTKEFFHTILDATSSHNNFKCAAVKAEFISKEARLICQTFLTK